MAQKLDRRAGRAVLNELRNLWLPYKGKEEDALECLEALKSFCEKQLASTPETPAAAPRQESSGFDRRRRGGSDRSGAPTE